MTSTAPIRSIAELQRYTQDVASRRPEDDPVVRKLQAAKRMVWLILLALSFLFYYLIECMEQALVLLR